MTLPPPPVPQKLREMLKDYPEHIERLQEVLIRSVERSRRAPLMPFDDAISALEGRLGTFISEARAELAAAEVAGDQQAIVQSKAKKFAFGAARADMGSLSDLQAYFSAWNQR